MTSLDRTATVADVIDVAMRSSVERLIAHETGVRTGGDPEDVHQARVATRRLRSDLRTFRDFVDHDWATELRAELRWLGGELGEVRDIEVMLDRLRSAAAQIPSEDQQAADRVLRRLVADWQGARSHVVDALASTRYSTLRARLLIAAEHARATTWAQLRATDALPRVVRKPWKKLRDEVEDLGDNPSDEALHRVRIRAKRARYAAEATIPVFGKPARRFGRALAEIQDVLGDHQDAVVARAWLAKSGSECSPTEAFAAGMLAEIQTRTAEEARAEFPAVWAAARAPKLRKWL
jgi:CHAD domain-containing protein